MTHHPFCVADHASLSLGASANVCKPVHSHTSVRSPPCVCVHAWVRILHIHPHACMISIGLHPLPASLTLAGGLNSQQPTCLIIPSAHSKSQNPPTDAQETPGTNVLETLSCHRRLTVAVPPPARRTPGLAGSPGSQVLPALAFLCSPSSELQGLAAHVCMTPVDSCPGCGLCTF